MPHTLTWQEQGQTRQAPWRNTAAQKPPAAIAVAEAGLSAKAALKSFRQGQALLWRGDYHQAVQLLSAVKRQLPAAASPDFHTVCSRRNAAVWPICCWWKSMPAIG